MTAGLWPGLIGRRHSAQRGIAARAAASAPLRTSRFAANAKLFGSGIVMRALARIERSNSTGQCELESYQAI